MDSLAHSQNECGVQLFALGSAHLRRSSYGLAKRQFSSSTDDPSITANSFDWVFVRKNKKLEVMIHIYGQDFSYNQDYCLFFIVHEVVWYKDRHKRLSTGMEQRTTCTEHKTTGMSDTSSSSGTGWSRFGIWSWFRSRCQAAGNQAADKTTTATATGTAAAAANGTTTATGDVAAAADGTATTAANNQATAANNQAATTDYRATTDSRTEAATDQI